VIKNKGVDSKDFKHNFYQSLMEAQENVRN
jgi:hypothetical protein